VIVSHAFLEPELRKGIAALAAYADVRVVTPSAWRVLIFRRKALTDSRDFIDLFRPIRAIKLFGGQYVFLSLTLGLRHPPPDVVHVEYEPWSIVFWQVAITRLVFARHAALVCNVKKNTFRAGNGIAGRIKRLLARLGIAQVGRFTAASEMTRELYIRRFGVPAPAIDVVTHLGVDTTNFQPGSRLPQPGRAVIGYTGRLEHQKGVDVLIAAVEECRRRGVDATLRIVGTGYQEADLRRTAESRPWLSIEPARPNSEIAAFMREIDLFVLPSRVLPDHEEHDAHALLEALASGVPCIATRSGINPEILRDSLGVVVAADAVAELAAAIERHVRRQRKDVDVVVYDGGQDRYPLLMSVE